MESVLPPAFVERMHALLGAEADAFFAALERSPALGLRVNPLKLRPERFERITPWALEPVPWALFGFRVAESARPGKHPYHAAGLYYLQEPSAMAVVEALDVRPGLQVLDLAAAPGGKATQIAGYLNGEGLLVANEVESSRIKPLGENLERWGARNAVITNETPERLADHFGACFDRVLLDAPCSGEGMFRKNPGARDEWSVEHVAGCAARQSRILDQAARLVAPDGLLVYSTCTFAPEENEQRIATFLAEHPQWSLIEIPKRHGFAAARPEWAGDLATPELTRAVRLWPHRVAGEGHFIALLHNGVRSERSERSLLPSAGFDRDESRHQKRGGRRGDRVVDPGAAARTAWQTFERESLTTSFPTERLSVHNDQVYLMPALLPDLSGLRVVRSGLWLGTAKPGRFEPSHALALALLPDEARHTISLTLDEAERYLRGETFANNGPDGWVLIGVDGWPLGWGRRVGGVVKNFYPKGLRWM
ncbi:MAG: RsmF rRNA methyltransferase first C-terminal domain-containing protein [Chloroflexi bacterium]|nr:RsmF rRNA methyltransferase first C-terminal domain-containing protein [Chloroflexota bacterium]